ncbi:MAG TPA: MFS transporter [Acidimicrobiia bacterium]|nr:MFS transporter [Acidimicrobiia bacterium]
MKKASETSLAPLRIAAFRRLWIAIMVFNVGHLVLVVASSWLILEMTGSPLWVSAMVGAPTVPLLLLALPAGAVADLFDRRKILVASSAIMMLASTGMALMTIGGIGSPAALIVLGVFLGIGVAFFNPAWQAIVPALVPQHLVPGAVSLNSASGGVATALGPALGGLLVATVGPAGSFVAASIGYAVMLGTSSLVRRSGWGSDIDTLPTAIAGGIRYLRFSDGYLALLVLGSAFGFTSAALRAMLPNLTSDALGGDVGLYGALLGVFGAGAMVGGVTRHQGSRLLGRRMIPRSIVAFGIAGVVVGGVPNLVVILAGVAISGLLWTWILATMNTVFQMLTPDWVRGRTMAAFVLAVFGILPIGALAAGALGDVIGAAGALVAFSAATVVVGGAAVRVELPVLEEIVPPVMATERSKGEVSPPSSKRPVTVVNTWTIASADEMAELTSVLGELRRLRLATGAYRWNAYQSIDDPARVSETYVVHSWEHHLQLEGRLDTRGKEMIERAERFGSPEQHVTSHLVDFEAAVPAPRHQGR